MVLQNKSDDSTVHHALQSCQIRMVLQNKSDNSNGHALKFPFEFIILKMFIAETYPLSQKLPGKRKFTQKLSRQLKFSRNFASFSLFAKMEKTVFVPTLRVRTACSGTYCANKPLMHSTGPKILAFIRISNKRKLHFVDPASLY
jgi:hypothetical protein